MTLAKADLNILERYGSLVKSVELRDKFMKILTEEFKKTIQGVLAITEQEQLLDHNPGLREILFVRNHYLDPLSYIQVDLLRRYREQLSDPSPRLLKAIHLSINGIASGMKNTG